MTTFSHHHFQPSLSTITIISPSLSTTYNHHHALQPPPLLTITVNSPSLSTTYNHHNGLQSPPLSTITVHSPSLSTTYSYYHHLQPPPTPSSFLLVPGGGLRWRLFSTTEQEAAAKSGVMKLRQIMLVRGSCRLLREVGRNSLWR